ncbi:hypothetical protein Hanom_Chr17g01547661 [Helianthus anomalus]
MVLIVFFSNSQNLLSTLISTGDARGTRRRIFNISNSSSLSSIQVTNITFFRLGDLAKINFTNSNSDL